MNKIILAPCDFISKIKQNSSDMNEIILASCDAGKTLIVFLFTMCFTLIVFLFTMCFTPFQARISNRLNFAHFVVNFVFTNQNGQESKLGLQNILINNCSSNKLFMLIKFKTNFIGPLNGRLPTTWSWRCNQHATSIVHMCCPL
jgi:hypothetical protein